MENNKKILKKTYLVALFGDFPKPELSKPRR